MLKMKRFPWSFMCVLGYLTILLTFSGSVPPVYGQDLVRVIPSLGKGPYEVLIFADYFCPPCRRIDTKAEALLKELVATNKVKVVFVDVPFSRTTPLYAKYYLYAANADPGGSSLLHVRSKLFEAAQDKRITEENALVVFLKEQKIPWKPMHEKAVFPLLNAMMKEHKVDQTPTCVIKYSPLEVKKYIGDIEIWYGLNQLRAHLAGAKK